MKHIVMFSYGIGSWAEAKLTVRKYGAENTLLLNADTKYEDEDTYAWGLAAARNVGAELVRIADGRDIWEVFLDRSFLGNTRVDVCSEELKRKVCRAWLGENYTPETCVIHVGIHWSEGERFQKIRKRHAENGGWRVECLLCEPPLIGYQELHAWAEREGLWKQRLYQLGFPHANCGGRCVKQGQAGWKLLLETMPERYLECERKEQSLREKLGKDVTILRDRRGGQTRPMTLREFRERLQAGGQCDLFDFGGCACFSGNGDEAA